jgi:hypothetical protein
MGCRRAGWYSYDGLDNDSVASADRIVPELQHVKPGDLFPWTPDATDGFIVKAVEPGRVLILGGDAGSLYRVIWSFVLEPLDGARTRLLTRASADYERRSVGLWLRLAGHPMHFATQRRQLLTLKRRAEQLLATFNFQRTNRGCCSSVSFAFLRIAVSPFSRTNMTIASFVSRQPV